MYVAGLYLTSKSNDAGPIVSSAEPKQLIMHFVRDVSAKKLQDGWSTGFDSNTAQTEPLKDRIATFS